MQKTESNLIKNNYKPIFETARKLKIKLVALNVDSEDLSLVEKGGYQGLPLKRLRKYCYY